MGKVKLLLGGVLFVAAVGFHLALAAYLVTEQPDDGKLYAQLARNVLEQGVFSGETQAPFSPTLIRLPGYPLFLAAVYAVAGHDNEMAVRLTQAVLYSITCLIIVLIAFHWIEDKTKGRKAAIWAFVLAAFCPFTAIFSAVILTENTTMFFLAGATLAATYAFKIRKKTRSLLWWYISGLLAGGGVLLRPDAGLFALGIGLTIAVSSLFGRGNFSHRVLDRCLKGIVFSLAFMLPLVPWTIRNERQFSVFQPLAPAHAEMPGEFVPHGYFLWLRTWIDDSRFIGPMLWNLEQKPIRIDDVPPYAFSSDEEKQRVAALLDQYNNSDPNHPLAPPAKPGDSQSDNSDESDDSSDEKDSNGDQPTDENVEFDLKISPESDAAFAQTANERVEREPWRYYVGLPAKRAASMWFDTHSDYYPFGGEIFPLTDIDESSNQHIWLPLFAGLTWIYTILAFAGAILLAVGGNGRSRLWLVMVLLLSLPRIAFFGTLENPEPRYLVELFVLAAILGGLALAKISFKKGTGVVSLKVSYGEEA